MNPILSLLYGLLAILAVLLVAMVVKNRKEKDTKPGASAEKIVREATRLDYRYQYDNIIVQRDGVWMGVKLSPRSTAHMGLDDVARYARRAADAINGMANGKKKVELQYRLTRLPLDVDKWADQLLVHAWNPSRMYRKYVEAQKQWLRASGSVVPTPVLLIQIDKLDRSALDKLAESVDAAVIGGHDDRLPPDLAARWSARARQILTQLQPLTDDNGDLVPLDRSDYMWLIRKPLSGHYTPDLGDFPSFRAWGEGEFRQWVDAVADNGRDHMALKLLNQDVASYERQPELPHLRSHTAVLLLTDWVDKAGLGERGLFEYLSGIGAEVSYRMWVKSKTELIGDLSKVKRNVDGEVKQYMKSRRLSPDEDDITEMDPLLAEEMVDSADALTDARRPGGGEGMEYQLLVQLSSDTEAHLNMLVEHVTKSLKDDFEATVSRIKRAQYRLLLTMLPGGGDPKGVTMGRRLSEPAQFGLAHPRVGVRLGNRQVTGRDGRTKGWVGDFIGLSEDTPVFESGHANLSRGAGAGVLIVGVSGGGKTNYALLKFFQDTESGVEGYAVDPKDDFAAFVHYIAFGPQVNDPDFQTEARAGTLGQPGSKFQPTNPQFWAETMVVDVVNSTAGLLDAWQVAHGDIALGSQICRDALQLFLSPDTHQLARTSLAIALQDVTADYVRRRDLYLRQNPAATPADIARNVALPSSWQVVQEAIKKNKEAAADEKLSLPERNSYLFVVTELNTLLESPTARVVFAESPVGMRLGGYRRTVFTLFGIQRPNPAEPIENWGEGERFGAGVIYLLTRLIALQMNGPKKRHRTTGLLTRPPRALWIDESYVVTSFAAGRSFLQVALAQGRSLNFLVYLLDQNASRVAKIEQNEGEEGGSGNQLQSVFAFKQRKGQGEVVAPLLTTSNTGQIAVQVRGEGDGGTLVTGRCLFRDMDNNLGQVDIEMMFRELLNAANTDADSRPIVQNVPISADPWEWEYSDSEERESFIDRGELISLEAEADEEASAYYETEQEAEALAAINEATSIETALQPAVTTADQSPEEGI